MVDGIREQESRGQVVRKARLALIMHVHPLRMLVNGIVNGAT